MKKLLMATALVSSFAAASVFAHDNTHRHIVHVRASNISMADVKELTQRIESLDHECLHVRLSSDHQSLYMDCSGTDKLHDITQEEIKRIEEIVRKFSGRTPGFTEGYTRHLPAARKYPIKLEKSDR